MDSVITIVFGLLGTPKDVCKAYQKNEGAISGLWVDESALRHAFEEPLRLEGEERDRLALEERRDRGHDSPEHQRRQNHRTHFALR